MIRRTEFCRGIRGGLTRTRRALAGGAACLWMTCGATLHAATSLTVGSGTASPSTPASVPLMLTSDTPVTALQFDLAFDGGKISSSAPALTGPAASTHVVASSEPVPGTRRVVIYSVRNVALTSGQILNLGFTTGASSAVTLPLTISNVIMSSPTANAITPVALTPGEVRLTPAGGAVRFSAATLSATGQVELQISGPAGGTASVQISSDLKVWTNVRSVSFSASGGATFTEALPADSRARFYRLAQH